MKALSSALLFATVASTSGTCTGVSSHLPASECSAWQTLFRAWGGQNWNGCSDSLYDPCACEMLTCVQDNSTYAPAGAKTIREIRLLNNNMVGTVPDELGDFKNLYHLTLIENFLQGPLPMKQMAKLSNLWDVDLGTNRFTGTIPTGFGAQGQLSGFNLNDNKLTGTIPEDLCDLKNLVWFNLRNNNLIGSIPSCLGNLQHVWFFEACNNSLTGTLPNLPFSQYTRHCDFSGNPFKCPLPPGASDCKGADGHEPIKCY